jgi:hypothetical protein
MVLTTQKNTTKKKVQSSGRPCFLAGSNYNRKKLRLEKKVQSSGRQLETRKNHIRTKKGAVVWSLVGAQNTKHNTHIIDTTTNKMSRATLPSSSFAPSLSMGRAVAPPNDCAAAPQCHAQAATRRGCARCCWFACLGRRNGKRHQIRETGGVPWP